jgi:hypothetical protein
MEILVELQPYILQGAVLLLLAALWWGIFG